jgi:hypothetical protein
MPPNVKVPVKSFGVTILLPASKCTAEVDFQGKPSPPQISGSRVRTDPSGNVILVSAFPAFTVSPARTGHMGTP